MASLSIKIPTAKVISLIEDKIATMKADIANYPQAKAEYAKAKAEFDKTLVQLTIDALTNRPELIGDKYNDPIRVQSNTHYGRSVSITVDADALGFPPVPVEPENPNAKMYVGREYVYPLDVLENTLKQLRLTEQETVNSSTYANVMKLL